MQVTITTTTTTSTTTTTTTTTPICFHPSYLLQPLSSSTLYLPRLPVPTSIPPITTTITATITTPTLAWAYILPPGSFSACNEACFSCCFVISPSFEIHG
ncbi:hypothetical protein E2C01_092513 [Portunus trituberculatus]|uniref:Uncharacterized protein n=1 Tax=Portunus trituberculatus TaxID=210409 RepID=A0A5B7JM54_PORTR|nr:hypothetical protein [Portunus trituberculatus]